MAGGGDVRSPASSSSRQWKPRTPREQGNQGSIGCPKEGPCSSSPSVNSKNSLPQMVTPVEPSKSLGAPLQKNNPVEPLQSLSSSLQMVTLVEQPKSLDSPPQMVTPVEPPKSLDSPLQMVTPADPPKSLNCTNDPFDICKVVNKDCFKLNRSLYEIGKEKRRAKSAATLQRLRPGMVLLKNFLKPDDQVKIIKHCRDLGVGTGGFYQPGYRDGAKLSLRMMCLGKNWEPDSSSYGGVRTFDGAQPPKIPNELTMFVKDAIEASHEFLKQRGGRASDPSVELPLMSPDICIVNFYTSAGKLGLHQDKDETEASLSSGLPVVSFSLGETAEFLYGDVRDEANASKIKLESGDVLIFGGKSRHIFHGVSSISQNIAPSWVTDEANLRPGRLNLTFRQY